MNKKIEILENRVRYYYTKNVVMPKDEQERIANMIKKGNTRGDLTVLSIETDDGMQEVSGKWWVLK